MSAIRFILETHTSRRDTYGNTYTFGCVRSTETGRSIAFHTHCPSNARYEITRAIEELTGAHCFWPTLHHIAVTDVPKRQFTRARSHANCLGNAPTARLLKALETVHPVEEHAA